MNFSQSIEHVFNNIDNINGRASRSEYNYWLLFNLLVRFFFEILIFFEIFLPLSLLFIIQLVFIALNVSVMVRRFHDINKSGWNYFWCFTVIGIIPVIYWLCFKKGDDKKNSYGKNPLK